MKTYLISLLLISIFINDGFAQSKNLRDEFTKDKKYISLDMLDSLYEVNRYTLNTQELYGVDETIEVYNVNIAGIALFSVLPDFRSESNWTEVNLADIQDGILSDRELNRMLRFTAFSGTSRTKRMDIQLVKKKGTSYWISNVCLLELFIRNTYVSDIHPSIFNVQQGTINIRQTPVSISQMMEIFEQSMDWQFPLDIRESRVSILANRDALEREYLSRTIDINGNTAYQFWTLTDWSSPAGYSYNRGVDRFIYIPNKGIVGGSYDFYFLVEFDTGWDHIFKPKRDLRPRYRKTKEELWQNVIEEKVMLAEEIKK